MDFLALYIYLRHRGKKPVDVVVVFLRVSLLIHPHSALRNRVECVKMSCNSYIIQMFRFDELLSFNMVSMRGKPHFAQLLFPLVSLEGLEP